MNTFKKHILRIKRRISPKKSCIFLQTSTLIQNLISLTPPMLNKASSFYQLVQPKEQVRQNHESDRL